MTTNSALSGEEVSALMAELGDDAAVAATGHGEVLAFVLGAEDARPIGRLAGLERIGEKMARKLRVSIETFAKTKAQVTADPIESRRCEDWIADQRDFVSLSTYRLPPLKGGMLIAIEAEFVISLVDSFYGGRGHVPNPLKRSEFTPAEESMLGRLSDMLITVLKESWAETVTIQPMLAGRETNSAYLSFARPEEGLMVQRFTIVPAQGRPGVITIAYPQATLRPIEAQLSAKIHDDKSPTDPEWRYRMACALEQVRLPVRSVLARPELTVRQLMQLKVGDVIPINLPARVPLLVAQKRLAEGSIGEQEGRAALMIEALGRGNDK